MDLDDPRPQNPVNSQYTMILFLQRIKLFLSHISDKTKPCFYDSDQGQIQNPWFPQIILWPEAVNPDDPVLVPRLQAVSHLTKPDKTIIFDRVKKIYNLLKLSFIISYH